MQYKYNNYVRHNMNDIIKTNKMNSVLQSRTIILFILFLIMWILLGFNTKTVDMEAYKSFYYWASKGVHYPGIEYGFYYFMRICTLCKFNYSTFLAIYALVGTTIMFLGLNKLIKENINVVLLLFLFFPYLHIIAALRNFMAFAITLWGVHYLVSNKKHKYIKYVICILIAAQFHISMLFALVYLFTKLPYKKIDKLIICFIVVTFILLFAQSQIVRLLTLISPKVSVYLSEGMTGTRFVTKIFLVLYYFVKYFISHWIYWEEKYEECSLSDILNKMCLLSIIILPVSFFNMNFMRIEYDSIIFMSILVFYESYNNILRSINKKKQIRVVYTLFYLVSGYILLYLFSYESVVQMFWQNNSIFDYLFTN